MSAAVHLEAADSWQGTSAAFGSYVTGPTISLLDAALSYAARGWPVHPCQGDKRPYTQHGVDSATTDPMQIQLWWAKWPNASIGLATGRASGLYILDEDADGAADHLELPPTLTAYTGKGKHYYYSLPPGDERWPNTAKKALGPKMDSRGDGGYVIAPPSIHTATGKAYAFGDDAEAIAELPENVVALLRAPHVPVAAAQGNLVALRPAVAGGVDIWERARRYLAKVEGAVSGSGGHGTTFRVANMLINGWAMHRHDAESFMFEWNATCSPPWSEKEIAHKLDDAVKAGHYNGRERGCLLTSSRPQDSDGVGWEVEAVEAVEAKELSAYDQAIADLMAVGFGVKIGGQKADDEREGFLPTSALFDEVFPETPWIIQGLITSRSVCTIGGEPKTTKTWALLEMAMAVATGTPAFGQYQTKVDPSGVALFLAEDTKRSVRNRLRALASSRGMDPKAACARIHAKYLQAIDLRDIQQLARLVVDVRAIPEVVTMVGLDPLRDCHGAEENSSTEMKVVTDAMRALRTVLGCTVQFVHHMGKNNEGGGKGGGKRAGQMMRGSSSLHGFVDCGLYLRDLKTDGQSTWTNKASVEIKQARGAGDFKLTWTVEDDGDEAVAGQWVVDRASQQAKAAEAAKEDEEMIEKMMTVLRAHRAKNQGATVHMAEVFLRMAVGVGSAKLRTALATAIERGLVGRDRRGIYDLTPSDSI